MNLVQLTPLDLAIAAVLVIALAACSLWLRLGVGRDLLVAATRMGLQLTLIGFVLKALFAQARWYWVALMALVMLLVAGREILARQKRRLRGGWAFLSGTGAVFLSSFAVTLIALGVIVRADPWYAPQYSIPILGMLLGNTMNGIALAVDRLSQGVWQQRALIEQRLMLGETAHEAMADLVRDCLRAGLIPTINAMAVAGIVSLPGMMTGQILAGSPPLEAVKYQILIWLLIAAGTGFGMILAVRVTARRLFDDRDRLRMDRFQSAMPAPKASRGGSIGHITGRALVVLGLLMALLGAVMHFTSERLYPAVVTVEIERSSTDIAAIGGNLEFG